MILRRTRCSSTSGNTVTVPYASIHIYYSTSRRQLRLDLMSLEPLGHHTPGRHRTRYVRETLTDARVDTKAFTAYTCRHASTSAASRGNVPTSLIMQSAGWRSTTTFSRFYDRPVQLSSEKNFIPQMLSVQPDDGSI